MPASSAGSEPGSPSAGDWPSWAAPTCPPSTRSRSSTRHPGSSPTGSEETIQLAVLDGLEVVYLARHDGRQPVRLTSGIGRRLPAFSTATGKAALASLDDAELQRRLAGLDDPAPADAQGPRQRRGAAGRHRPDPGRAATRWTTRRRWRASSATACSCPAGSPAMRPDAASITLLKVRATAERVPALLADLRRLAARPVRPAPTRLAPLSPGRRVAAALPPDDRGPFGLGQGADQRARRGRDLFVRSRQQADRPVRAEQKTLGTEGLQRLSRRTAAGRRPSSPASRLR